MTKIYSIAAMALSAIVCFNASAEITKYPVTSFSKSQPSITKVQTQATHVAPLRAASVASDAINAYDIAGIYDMTAINEQRGSYVSGEVEITPNNEIDIIIDGVAAGISIVGSVDPDGLVIIPTDQLLTYVSSYDEYAYFRHYLWTEDYTDIYPTDDPIIGIYDAETKCVIFDEDDIFAVEGKAATTDEWTGLSDGFYQLWDTMGWTKQAEEVDDSADWEACGTADFVDGWIFPEYGVDQFDYIVREVPVQKSIVEEGVYRLVDPYHFSGNLIASYNESTKVGYIKFNIADPEFPYVYPEIKSGYADENGDFYCYDINGFYYELYGYPKDVIMAAVPDLSTYDAETGIMNIPYAMFGITSNPNGGYSWQDSAGAPVDMTSQIKLNEIPTGIGAVSVSDKNAPAEYYNLQGIRVANPVSGQVYIRVQAGKVQKIIR